MEIFKNEFDKLYENLSLINEADTLSDKGFSNPSEEPLSADDIQTAIDNASSKVKSLFGPAKASISFETILSLINNSDNSSLTIEEQLEAWSLIIKIISTKYNRAFMKDKYKTWEERLAGFISVYGVEVAIKNSLEKHFEKTFYFTDGKSHNLLFAEHGEDAPDLKVSLNNNSDTLSFEVKPLNSTSSVHDADFVVRYNATATSVKFKIVPYKASNITWEALRDAIEFEQEFEAPLDSNLKVTAGKIKVLYNKLLKTSGTAESTAELEYRTALSKATNAHKKAEQKEKSFLKATLEQEKKVIAGKDSKEVLKQQAKALKDFAALEKNVTQTIDTLVTTTTTATDTHVETSVSEDLDNASKELTTLINCKAELATTLNTLTTSKVKENYNMANLLEAYNLLEWSDPQAAKAFWTAAKEGKIDEDSFEAAYKDELWNLDLWPSVVSHSGIAERSSYGEIKKAAEENPDSWAVKALLKLWVLQFKDNAPSLRKEKEEARKLQLQKEKEEKEQKIKELTDKYVPPVKDILEKLIVEKVQPICGELHKNYDNAVSKVKEIKKLSRDLINLVHIKNWLPVPPSRSKCVDYSISISGYNQKDPHIRVSFDKILAKSVSDLRPGLSDQDRAKINNLDSYNGGDSFYFSASAFETNPDIIKADLSIFLDLIVKPATKNHPLIDEANSTYEKVVYQVEEAKKAKAAVEAGKPVNPDFIANILADIKESRRQASAEAASWRSVMDGSDGAAYEMEIYKAAKRIAPYLFDCHWRSYVGERQIAEWKPTDSDDALGTALEDTIHAYCAELNIEILKD